MKAVTIVARLLLGLIFTVFGANFFLQFLPMPDMPDVAKSVAMSYMVSKVMHVAHAIELFSGLLLISGFFVPLALTLLGPIVVNIVLFHVVLTPPQDLAVPVAVALIEVFLIWRYRPYFRGLFTFGARPVQATDS